MNENKALVRRYLEDALAEARSGNLAATDESLTSDAAFYDPGRPPSVGTETQRQRSVMLLGAFPDARFGIEDIVAEGDKAAVRRVFGNTHQGAFMGIPPTNKEVAMPGITIYRLAGGKIAEAGPNFDQSGMLQPLGVLPPGQNGV